MTRIDKWRIIELKKILNECELLLSSLKCHCDKRLYGTRTKHWKDLCPLNYRFQIKKRNKKTILAS